ncbi:MAG: hypothetical protein IK080_02940 [Clostridia bacterium]|nr:hypothetical protein [Clostridia bacterium]
MQPFYNQATLSYNKTVTTSNLVRGTLRTALQVTKTPVKDTYVHGEEITYLISIQNTGDTAFTGLTVTDDLGAYAFGTGTVVPLTYVDGTLTVLADGVPTTGPAVQETDPLTVTGVNVPAGGSVVIAYAVTVNSYAPLGAQAAVTNTATVDGDGMTAPMTATAEITAADGVTLAITKSIDPNPVTERGQVTYTFEICNYGSQPATAADNAVLTDQFDPVLSALTAMLNGTPMTAATDYTYDEDSGLFETVAGVLTVPAAAYAQDADTGAWSITPGLATLAVTGTI